MYIYRYYSKKFFCLSLSVCLFVFGDVKENLSNEEICKFIFGQPKTSTNLPEDQILEFWIRFFVIKFFYAICNVFSRFGQIFCHYLKESDFNLLARNNKFCLFFNELCSIFFFIYTAILCLKTEKVFFSFFSL